MEREFHKRELVNKGEMAMPVTAGWSGVLQSILVSRAKKSDDCPLVTEFVRAFDFPSTPKLSC